MNNRFSEWACRIEGRDRAGAVSEAERSCRLREGMDAAERRRREMIANRDRFLAEIRKTWRI